MTWYHRPLARLKVVVPDRIYISAMPTRRGLEVAQERRHFRTIINLFPEETAQRSPILGDELKFAREHGIRYVGSPSDPSPAASDAFLNQTLALAQDPSAWPILVHCHGCMDRSPAWMGIYRFVVQGRPLLEVMQEIERHRGYRPKASVILLYNRVLPPRARERYQADPTAAILRQCAAGTFDPMLGATRAAAPASRRPDQRDVGLKDRPALRLVSASRDPPRDDVPARRLPAASSRPGPRLLVRGDPLPDLLAVDADLGRRGEAQAHHIALDGDHGDR